MGVAQIIAALLPIFLQAEPTLVKDIANLIHGNPQQQGEADDAYVVRLQTLMDQNTAADDATNKTVQS